MAFRSSSFWIIAAAFLIAPLTVKTAPSIANSSSIPTRCKCLSSQSCFPPPSAFASLSQRLTYPVFPIYPPSYPCHDPQYNATQCSIVAENYYDSQWRSDQPGACENDLLEYSLDLVERCPFSLNSSGFVDDAVRASACMQGRVPTMGVNATSVSDVQETVRFATEWNLKLVIHNTGHDFLGRALGEGGLLLWTHNFVFMNFTDNFVPEQSEPSGYPAITLGPGVQWLEAYNFANENNVTVAGGIGPEGTVGAAGGWPLGGGHNLLSPSLGLGVDNVLQYTVVTASSDSLTVNANLNSSLFWAMRGGGGGTFAVVTSITYRVHPITPLYAYFYEALFDNNDTFIDIIDTWHRALPAIADAGWSGYYEFGQQFFTLQYVLPNGDVGVGNTTLGPFLDAAANISGVLVNVALSIEYGSFYEWFIDNIIDPVNVVGFNYTGGPGLGHDFASASWLLPRSLFEDNATISKVSAAYSYISEGIGQHVGGGVVSQVPPNATGLHPAWRTALIDLAIGAEWNDGLTAAEVQAYRQNVTDQIAPLRALTPGGGQYLNEPDYLVPDFQSSNWGTNYERLLQIKREVDPDDLFVVTQGVGSEFWDVNQNCRLF